MWKIDNIQKWRNVKHTHTLAHTDKTSIYERCKLLLAFLQQCVTTVVWNKRESVFSRSKAKLCSSVWPSGRTVHMSLFVAHLPPSSFPLSLSPLRRLLNILALSEEQKKNSTLSATCVLSETLFSVLLTAHAPLAASSSPPLPPPRLLPVFTLDSSTSSFAMQNKTVPQWVVSADGCVLAMSLGVGAGAIARCGAREAPACATERWGPCRTSRNAPIGCPRSRGCPTGDAFETLSGRSRVFLLAPGSLERRGEERSGCYSLQMTCLTEIEKSRTLLDQI